MYLYEGKVLDINAPFVGPDGIQFGAGGLPARPDKMEEYGIVKLPGPVIPDPEYYVSSTSTDGTVTSTPRDFAQVQAAQIAKVNSTAGYLLQPTDWQVIRKMERGVAIDPSVETYRAAVVNASNVTVGALQAATTLGQLQAVAAPAWPAPL